MGGGRGRRLVSPGRGQGPRSAPGHLSGLLQVRASWGLMQMRRGFAAVPGSGWDWASAGPWSPCDLSPLDHRAGGQAGSGRSSLGATSPSLAGCGLGKPWDHCPTSPPARGLLCPFQPPEMTGDLSTCLSVPQTLESGLGLDKAGAPKGPVLRPVLRKLPVQERQSQDQIPPSARSGLGPREG